MAEQYKIWIEQFEAAENIEDDFGTQKALEYLVGEKFLNFLEAAEIPAFVAKIKTIFERWQLAQYLETPRTPSHLSSSGSDSGFGIDACSGIGETRLRPLLPVGFRRCPVFRDYSTKTPSTTSSPVEMAAVESFTTIDTTSGLPRDFKLRSIGAVGA
jgi:hypothetical protein